jgi:hypothetical protein
MAGRGRAPKPERRNSSDKPTRGEIQHAPAVGWQHGKMPAPPDGLKAESIETWETWLGAWFAAFWTPSDVPGLRSMVLLYDQVLRGEYQRHAELRLMMDTYGVTPKGQQDRRWFPPKADKEPTLKATGTDGGYAHLRSVP